MANPNPIQSAQKQADAWNLHYPVGTPVIAEVTKGRLVKSITSSSAITIQDRPVIWIEDAHCAIPLTEIRPDHERIEAKRGSILNARRYIVTVPPNREMVLMLEGYQGEIVINTEGQSPTVRLKTHDEDNSPAQFVFHDRLEAVCDPS